ncbi:MAG: cytochrome BD ubiquinol oxidase subunit II, partial [Proteobacteria bacterium]|nr:cytochrome BD ubiquinol oxidase subunit II [Pseudomonadota bacterium]
EVNPQIAAKWFVLPNFFFLLPIPLLAFGLFAWVELTLQTLPQKRDRHSWVPFAGTVGLFLTGFLGLGYSFFPYIVPGQLTIWQAASSVEALTIILVGALIVLPAIVGYTIYAYRVFWGKASTLHYE